MKLVIVFERPTTVAVTINNAFARVYKSLCEITCYLYQISTIVQLPKQNI